MLLLNAHIVLVELLINFKLSNIVVYTKQQKLRHGYYTNILRSTTFVKMRFSARNI